MVPVYQDTDKVLPDFDFVEDRQNAPTASIAINLHPHSFEEEDSRRIFSADLLDELGFDQ